MSRTLFCLPLLGLALLAFGVASPASAQTEPVWERPALGPPPALELPPIERFTLSNGLTVLLMEKHGVPIAQVNLVVRAGSVDDPAEKPGLAAMTADLLDEGAGGRSALALADAVDYLGVTLQTGAAFHETTVALHTPVARLDSALGLMADVALRPAFASEELDRLRDRLLTGFTQRRDQPRAIAGVLFGQVLFPDAHPYGRPIAGSPAGVRALAASDLAAFHRRHFRPANAALIVVGDVTAATMRPRLEARFGAAAWPAGDAPTPARVATAAQVGARTIYLVDKPGAAQSVIRIGRIGVERATEDYFALEVMNTILGGSFTSRLNQNLRERNGYSYGAGSGFSYRPVAGPFTASSDVQTNATAPALTEFFRELRAIREPVADSELVRARSYAALSFPEPFQTVAGTAAMLAEMYLYGLPERYFRDYTGRILAVTQADVQRVARQYLDPDRVAVVVVGDRAQIEAGVRALALGPVELRSIDDVLGVPEE